MRYLGTREVPIEALTGYPGNPRVHDTAVLEESARVNGQYRSVVARERPGPDGTLTLQLLAGHGTVAAFAATGTAQVRVEVIEADDTEARRIVVVDNRAGDLAGYDNELLAALLGDLGGDWPGTGWDDDTLAALTASLRDPLPDLAACELTGRRARLIELDPRYADVICARFQALTQVVPVREADGAAVDFSGAG